MAGSGGDAIIYNRGENLAVFRCGGEETPTRGMEKLLYFFSSGFVCLFSCGKCARRGVGSLMAARETGSHAWCWGERGRVEI